MGAKRFIEIGFLCGGIAFAGIGNAFGVKGSKNDKRDVSDKMHKKKKAYSLRKDAEVLGSKRKAFIGRSTEFKPGVSPWNASDGVWEPHAFDNEPTGGDVSNFLPGRYDDDHEMKHFECYVREPAKNFLKLSEVTNACAIPPIVYRMPPRQVKRIGFLIRKEMQRRRLKAEKQFRMEFEQAKAEAEAKEMKLLEEAELFIQGSDKASENM